MGDRNGRPGPPADRDAELSARLSQLDRRLDVERAARQAEVRRDTAPVRPGMGQALRLGADFVAGVALGAALGWGFDRLFGTSPWGLVVLLLLGFVAGVLSVMRSAGLIKPEPWRRTTPPTETDKG